MRKLIFALLMCVPVAGWGAVSSGTFTIGTGGDFTSLGDFEANLAATLTGDVTGQYITEMTDSRVVFEGTTTAADKQIYITVATNVRHTGTAASGVKVTTSDQYHPAIRVLDDYVNIDGLVVSNTASANPEPCILFYDCIPGKATNIVVAGSNNNGISYLGNSIEGTSDIYNCIVNDCVGSGINVESYAGSSVVINVYNNTVMNCGKGINRGGDVIVNLTNNYCGENTNGDYSGTFGTTNTNGSSDTTSPQSGLRSLSPTFTGTSDFHLVSSDTDLINAGTDLSAYFTKDIDGEARPTGSGTWDIGADEYASSGGGDTPSAFPQILIFQ